MDLSALPPEQEWKQKTDQSYRQTRSHGPEIKP